MSTIAVFINYRELRDSDLFKINFPIIFSEDNEILIDILKNKNYTPFNLNLNISEQALSMKSFKSDDMVKILESDKFIKKIPENSIIHSFEMLFDPSYKLDPVKALLDIGKITPIAIAWPGLIDYGTVIYGDYGKSKDYFKRNIIDENIIFIK